MAAEWDLLSMIVTYPRFFSHTYGNFCLTNSPGLSQRKTHILTPHPRVPLTHSEASL